MCFTDKYGSFYRFPSVGMWQACQVQLSKAVDFWFMSYFIFRKQILEWKGIPQNPLFISEWKSAECTDHVDSKVLVIDFDKKMSMWNECLS